MVPRNFFLLIYSGNSFVFISFNIKYKLIQTTVLVLLNNNAIRQVQCRITKQSRLLKLHGFLDYCSG